MVFSMDDNYHGIGDYIENGYTMHTDEELLAWISERNARQKVDIKKISLEECTPWYYDEQAGWIRNKGLTFFQIIGAVQKSKSHSTIEQPIILQKEVGYLGILACKINGVWHFLMQAKVEPGNINCMQLSPTIQATKSNFTRKHGGKAPAYLELFTNVRKENIVVDQLQSEQSSRFLGKRNRNIIIKTDIPVEEMASHRWMTLAQIKKFLEYDNLVNMDTRTVFSCMPYIFFRDHVKGYAPCFIESLHKIDRESLVELYANMNDYKMFAEYEITQVPLYSLSNWHMDGNVFRHKDRYPFEVVFCGMEIEGREVVNWNQPLFAAAGIATFGLICCNDDGILKVLVKLKSEIGCFDGVEIGPTIHEEFGTTEERDSVAAYFFEQLSNKEHIVADVLLSEEGGRFYHEQNRNVILMVDKNDLPLDQKGYFWCSFGTLNALVQINNCLNIQLRNMLMLLVLNSTDNNLKFI